MAKKKDTRFRRLVDGLARGNILVPTLEKALLNRGHTWPEEYAIKVVNKERIWDGYFHPSGHCLAPELELYFQFHPEILLPDYLSVEQIMTFQVGSAYHALIQSMMMNMNLIDESHVEQHFRDEKRHVSGTLDIRNMDMPNGMNMPVEIKSAGYGANIPEHFMSKYVAQLNVYMDVGCGPEPKEYGLLLILEKTAPHRFREILVQRDEALLDYIYARWNRVLEAVEFKDPSMLEFPCHVFDSKDHKECPARQVCPLGMPTGEKSLRKMQYG